MADWFKFYNDALDGGSMQYCISEQPLVTSVWLVILSEASKRRSSKFPWSDVDFELLGFARKVNISPGIFNECLVLLEHSKLIFRKSGNLEIIGWDKMQSDYARGLSKGYYKHTSKKLASNSQVSSVRGEESRVEKKEGSPQSGEGRAFIEGWCQSYKSQWGIDYSFKGGRDGKAVKELMMLGILRLDLLETAKKVWAVIPPTFESRQAQTIHGFREYINQLNLLAKNGNHQTSKPNPRNLGIIRGPTNYAIAKPRFQREREEAEMAAQVAQAQANPPEAKSP